MNLELEEMTSTFLPTPYGEFSLYCFSESHLILAMGELQGGPILVRIHSECLTGDVFGSKRCDCGTQLQEALKKIAEEKRGLLIYLKGHEGRGIGLYSKIKAYALQDEGVDTVEANLKLGYPIDNRQYDEAAWILKKLKISQVRLMTHNPEKEKCLKNHGIAVVEIVPLAIATTCENALYLLTKKEKMGHHLEIVSS